MGDRGTRKWILVVNNYTEEDITQLHKDFLKYGKKFICAKEIGDSGTPHLQGYVMFKNSRNLETLKKVNKKAHWEAAKGNVEQNKKYCSKDNDIVFEQDMIEDSIVPLTDRVNALFGFEVISRRKNYEKFLKEVDINMDGYEDFKKYLEDKLDCDDLMRYKR